MSKKIELADILKCFHLKDGWNHEPKPRKNAPLRVFEVCNRIKKRENVKDEDLVFVVQWLHANWERFSPQELYRRATMEARWTVARRQESAMAAEKIDVQLGARELFRTMAAKGIKLPEEG